MAKKSSIEKNNHRRDLVARDAKKRADGNGWEVFVHGGRTPTGKDAVAWAREVADRGAGEILLVESNACFNTPAEGAIEPAGGTFATEIMNAIDGQPCRGSELGINIGIGEVVEPEYFLQRCFAFGVGRERQGIKIEL